MAVGCDPSTDAAKLNLGRRRMVRATLRKMRRYEARYELTSDRVEAEMSAGRLRETAEVCDWVIAYHSYLSLQNGR